MKSILLLFFLISPLYATGNSTDCLAPHPLYFTIDGRPSQTKTPQGLVVWDGQHLSMDGKKVLKMTEEDVEAPEPARTIEQPMFETQKPIVNTGKEAPKKRERREPKGKVPVIWGDKYLGVYDDKEPPGNGREIYRFPLWGCGWIVGILGLLVFMSFFIGFAATLKLLIFFSLIAGLVFLWKRF